MAAASDNASWRVEEKVTERTVERNFTAFRSYLEKNIKAIGLIAPYYDLFSTGTRLQFLSNNNCSSLNILMFGTVCIYCCYRGPRGRLAMPNEPPSLNKDVHFTSLHFTSVTSLLYRMLLLLYLPCILKPASA